MYGAALIYLLGGGMDNKLKPSYTTLFLDEALIKADGRYTRRALSVLPRLVSRSSSPPLKARRVRYWRSPPRHT